MLTSKLALLSLLGCTDYTYFTQTQTDVFQQQRRNTVDILLVVDNSCSMVEEQEKLASNFDNFIQFFDGVDVDWQIAVTTTDTVQEQFSGRFVGGDDEIILTTPTGSLIDRVAYDRWGWDIPEGAALSLDPSVTNSAYNDVADNWCVATDAYGDGDLGTPGSDNPACEGGGNFTDDTAETDDTGAGEPIAPQVGDVLITEFMADPGAVADSLGEWVEIKNTAGEPIDLSGYILRDNGRNGMAIPAGTVLATDAYLVVARSTDTAENGGLTADLASGPAFTLNNEITILTPQVAGASEIFAENVALGTSGAGIEMGMEAARLALAEPLLSTENAGFLRDDANLSLIFVSDEDDDSARPVDDYLKWWTDLKGPAAYRDHLMFNISAVVGPQEPEFAGQPSCSSTDGVAYYGKRYIDLANRTEGLVESICAEDFSNLATELGLVLSGLAVEFELSDTPDPTTFKVELYETADLSSFVRELEEGVDWNYILERNAIRFEEDQVPPAEYYILVEYEIQAGTVLEDTQ